MFLNKQLGFPENTLGHWNFVQDTGRRPDPYENLEIVGTGATCVIISRDTKNWQRLFEMSALEELILERPDQEQIDSLGKLSSLKRLRISYSRSKSLDAIGSLQNLEELHLENTSGLEDISLLCRLPDLRALMLHTLGRVSDFSALGSAGNLRYLNIAGTFDQKQKVTDLSWLHSLHQLEVLLLSDVRIEKPESIRSGLAGPLALRSLILDSNAFNLEGLAWIEANHPDVNGARRLPFMRYGGSRERVRPPEVWATVSEEELRKEAPGIEIDEKGRRWRFNRHEALLLGKGERTVYGKAETVDRKCREHAERYYNLVASFRSEIPSDKKHT